MNQENQIFHFHICSYFHTMTFCKDKSGAITVMINTGYIEREKNSSALSAALATTIKYRGIPISIVITGDIKTYSQMCFVVNLWGYCMSKNPKKTNRKYVCMSSRKLNTVLFIFW